MRAIVRLPALVAALAGLSAAFPEGRVVAQESAESLLTAGQYQEEIAGDLAAAARIYRDALKRYPDQRRTAALISVRLGLCLERLGNSGALEVFRSIVHDFPDQHDCVALARRKINPLAQKRSVHRLTREYFARTGIDLMSATSYDGSHVVSTDWSTGNLVLTEPGGAAEVIVRSAWPVSLSFPFNPIWSRDGNWIAYSWYRGPYFVELHAYSLATKKTELLYADPQLSLQPQDWSPDGGSILVKVIDPRSDPSNRLEIVQLPSRSLTPVVGLTRHSRGLRFSPDGRFIVLDRLENVYRNIIVRELRTGEEHIVSSELPSIVGYDAPVWSRDGSLVLCRGLDQYSLWAIPVKEGKGAGRPFRIQANVPGALLAMRSLQEDGPSRSNPLLDVATANVGRIPAAFTEEFNNSALDPAWRIFRWERPNVYGYLTLGRYSLAHRSGYLRLFPDPMTTDPDYQNYVPKFGGWYWVYPGLSLNRWFSGDAWTLEAGAEYSMVSGVNGRWATLSVFVDPAGTSATVVRIVRGKDVVPEHGRVDVIISHEGATIAENLECRSPRDTCGGAPFRYDLRVVRNGLALTVSISDDRRVSYSDVLSCTLPHATSTSLQMVAISGGSWFIPAGAYADWDYVRVLPLR